MAGAVHTWLAIVIGPLILIFLGVLLFKLISELLRLSRDHEFPAFESTWGGLGRGLGGWSVNRTMVIGLFTLLVLLLFGSVTFELPANGSKPVNNTDTDKKAECAPEKKPKPAATATVNSESTKAAASDTGKNPQPTGKE